MKFEIFVISCYFVINFSTSLKLSTALENGIPDVNNVLENQEELFLNDLLSVSQTNSSGHREANALYKSKFGHLLVKPMSDFQENRKIKIRNNNCISVGLDIFEQFLTAFGQSIEKLSIDYFFIHAAKHKEIGKWINTYCSDTLVKFQVNGYIEGGFDDMKKPFKKVKNVAFDGIWRNLTDNTLGFNELFPEMRVLNLTLTQFFHTDSHIFNYHYSKLVELNASVKPSVDFMKFLERNPQLEVLRLKATSMELLRTINGNLLDLRSLDFVVPQDLSSYQGPNVTFEYVKEATVRDFNYNMRSLKIAFNRLERLELAVAGRIDDKWIDFIGANKGLKSLVISSGDVNNSTLTTLSSKFDGLTRADIHCDSSVEIKTVREFLQNNPLLKKVILNFSKGPIIYFNFLTKLLKDEWKVSNLNKDFNQISITKSKPDIMKAEKETDVETVENIQNSTETAVQNATVSENNSENSASNILSSVLLTVTLMTVIFY